MDGILLQQANAQPVARTTVKGRTTYVFMIPDGIQPSFRFEDTARVTGDIPFFTVRKDGDVWEVGLMEQKARLSSPMVLNIAPLREGARVNVESAMAARNEEVRQIVAQLKDVKVQPVYEIKL